MSAGVSYPHALDGFFEEMSLGKRGTTQKTVPDGDECDHIAALLRRGVRNGVGFVMWEIRTAPGVRLDQDALDQIADCVLEAQMSGEVPATDEEGFPAPDAQWRVCVRR